MTKKGETKENETIKSQSEDPNISEDTTQDVIEEQGAPQIADDMDTEETVMAVVTKLATELAEAKDALLRKVAEFENFRKRTSKEKDDLYSYTVATTVLSILPAIDSFELALKTPCEDESFKKGCELIYNQFIDQLKKLGITEMECTGQPFSPEHHNAVLHIEDENYGDNEVVEVLIKGYMHGERVVRHAMVKVAN